MKQQEISIWERGVTDAPLPPLVDQQSGEDTTNPFLTRYHTFGRIYRLSRPGQKPLVVLSGTEANSFTSRYGDEFFMSAEVWKDFNTAVDGIPGGLAITRDGEANHKRRMQVGRDYSRIKVLDQLPRLLNITQEYSQWQPGQNIDVVYAMQRLVAEQLSQLLINYPVGDYLEDLVSFISITVVGSFGAKKRAALSSPRYQRAKERVLELGQKIIEAHRSFPPSERKPDLIDDALARSAAQPEIYPAWRLPYAGLGPLLAGLETVARANSFLFYALFTNPAAFSRVLAEIDQAFAQGPLTWEALKAMSATQGAAMETLRMYVGSNFNAFVAQPFTFAGYRLEPGDEVFIAISVTHFLPELFPHPETFDIDRYCDPRNEHRQRGAYAPFGLGEHTCLGAGIAEIQLMTTTALLLHTYQFELSSPEYHLLPGQDLPVEDDVDPTSHQKFRLKVTSKR